MLLVSFLYILWLICLSKQKIRCHITGHVLNINFLMITKTIPLLLFVILSLSEVIHVLLLRESPLGLQVGLLSLNLIKMRWSFEL